VIVPSLGSAPEMKKIMATNSPSLSAAAGRMRRHRQRRREGLRLLRIELFEEEVDALIRAGLLEPQRRNDSNAVICALYGLFDRVFSRMTRNAARTW
jgi:hypothetical protein